jgi:hypothetical protein
MGSRIDFWITARQTPKLVGSDKWRKRIEQKVTLHRHCKRIAVPSENGQNAGNHEAVSGRNSTVRFLLPPWRK